MAQTTRRKPAARATAAQSTAQATLIEAAEARDGIGAATAVQRQAFLRLERLCEEGLRFATERMEENRNTIHALVSTRSLPDRVSIWGRHVERTMQQYATKMGALTELYAAQARETVEETAEAAQAAAAAVTEVAPSPMAEATPPLPEEAPTASAAEPVAEAAVEAAEAVEPQPAAEPAQEPEAPRENE